MSGSAPKFLIVTEAERRAITRARGREANDLLAEAVTEVLATAWLIEAGAGTEPTDDRGRLVQAAARQVLAIAVWAEPRNGATPS